MIRVACDTVVKVPVFLPHGSMFKEFHLGINAISAVRVRRAGNDYKHAMTSRHL